MGLIVINVSRAATENETPVAIAAIDKADIGINLQPHARVAEAVTGHIARAHAGNAQTIGAGGFGRCDHAEAVSSSLCRGQLPERPYW